MYGTIVSEWTRDGDAMLLKVTVPANTSATVYLPSNPREAKRVESGSYEFKSKVK